METVGRRVEFEWQLIKGSPARLARQCRVSAVHLVPLIVLLKHSRANAPVSALEMQRDT